MNAIRRRDTATPERVLDIMIQAAEPVDQGRIARELGANTCVGVSRILARLEDASFVERTDDGWRVSRVSKVRDRWWAARVLKVHYRRRGEDDLARFMATEEETFHHQMKLEEGNGAAT